MSRVFALIAIFALFSVLTTGEISAAPLEADFSLLSDQPLFSAEVDTFLGQKDRRHGGGGRVWSNLYYGDSTIKPRNEDKIDPVFYGVQLGFDLAGRHGVYSTFFANVNQSKTKIGGEDYSTVDNYLLGYGKFFYLSGCHIVFTGSLGYDSYKVTDTNTYKGDGLQANLFSEFGLNFPFGQWRFKPFYALQYDFLYHGNIRYALDVIEKDWNGHGVNQLFGLRVTWKVLEKLELQGRSTWIHEMLDKPPPFYRVRFSPMHGINTPAMMYHRGKTGRDWAWLGLGAKLEGAFNIYLFADYDILFNERHITHLASVGLCLGW
jgi:hypothetical protein